MIVYVVLAAIALLVLGTPKQAAKYGSDAGNQGGTSTPVPDKYTPPFFAWNNASTGAVPKTTLAFPPLNGITPGAGAGVHNNSLLAGNFNASPATPVRIPISGDLINDYEPTSVSYEQALSYQNNRVGGNNVRQVLAE